VRIFSALQAHLEWLDCSSMRLDPLPVKPFIGVVELGLMVVELNDC